MGRDTIKDPNTKTLQINNNLIRKEIRFNLINKGDETLSFSVCFLLLKTTDT